MNVKVYDNVHDSHWTNHFPHTKFFTFIDRLSLCNHALSNGESHIVKEDRHMVTEASWKRIWKWSWHMSVTNHII